jgi:hypothetical protein
LLLTVLVVMVVAECGCRWWFQAAVSPPFSFVSAFPPSLSVCASFSVSHGAGAVTNDGEGGGSWRWLWVALVAVANWGELRVVDGFFSLCFPCPLFIFSCCSRFFFYF